jgi:hypothetical protein
VGKAQGITPPPRDTKLDLISTHYLVIPRRAFFQIDTGDGDENYVHRFDADCSDAVRDLVLWDSTGSEIRRWISRSSLVEYFEGEHRVPDCPHCFAYAASHDIEESPPSTEVAATAHPKIAEIIAAGESLTLEFKSSFRWDVKDKCVNKSLQRIIAKTVAGFANASGGTLLIGVADDGNVLGIEPDIRSLGRKDLDGFEQAVIQTLSNHLGGHIASLVRIRFESPSVDATVCVIDVGRSAKPVYYREADSPSFIVRSGNTTRPLDVEEAHKYIEEHWPK